MYGTIAEKYPGPIIEIFVQGLANIGFDPILKTIRKHLGMDVAFISHFRVSDRTLEHIDAEGISPLRVGEVIPLEEGYCRKVVLGELPQLIPDTSLVPAAMDIPATKQIPIGSHISVPIMLEDGLVYGTLCCFSYKPDETLGERDLKVMQAFAEVLASRIGELDEGARMKESMANEIRSVLGIGAPRIVYQPVYALDTGELTCVECLSRFDVAPDRTPDTWFAMAQEVGWGCDLESLAIRKSLRALNVFPRDVSLAVNSSPEFVMSGALQALLENVDLKRVVLELTEHATVTDYNLLNTMLQPLRNQGLRLAIDDAGAGYASMRHILSLHPDFIKLDMSLTRNIDTDPTRRALAKALIGFARDIGSCITAEGVETEGELQMLRSLGVQKVQGYYLSKPLPLDEVLLLGSKKMPPKRANGYGSAMVQGAA